MASNPEEWLNQADYDLDTAEFMFRGKRYFYAVFMCHLAIEKALKGVYHKRSGRIPPKTHNLEFLLDKMKLEPPDEMKVFITSINQQNVTTRYPEDIRTVQETYNRSTARSILTQAKETVRWIQLEFSKS